MFCFWNVCILVAKFVKKYCFFNINNLIFELFYSACLLYVATDGGV